MALVTLPEAAMKCGYSVELLESLCKRSPKGRTGRKLEHRTVDEIVYVDERELEAYRAYLREPWPLLASGERPKIPRAIADDVRAEAHYGCAICGWLNQNELAHIEPFAGSLCHSPDNLVLLCPNHHTAYDYGHCVSAHVERDHVLKAKAMKRSARQRVLRHEGNVAAALRAAMSAIKRIETAAETADDDLREVYVTELDAVMATIPELTRKAQDAASADQDFATAEAELMKAAPRLRALTERHVDDSREADVRSTAREVVAVSSNVLDLDEVSCPRCSGTGQTGLMGQLCSFCCGECRISHQRASEYDPDEIDEVECPHCEGRGQRGVNGDLCGFCWGARFVTSEVADAFDPEDLDEVDCPRCNGTGQTGMVGDVCTYCRGRMQVPAQEASDYDADSLDEVDCPRCNGRGQIGVANELCDVCRGSCYVSSERAAAFDPDDHGVDCPRCSGQGVIGQRGAFCPLCKGRCEVDPFVASQYLDYLDAEA